MDFLWHPQISFFTTEKWCTLKEKNNFQLWAQELLLQKFLIFLFYKCVFSNMLHHKTKININKVMLHRRSFHLYLNVHKKEIYIQQCVLYISLLSIFWMNQCNTKKHNKGILRNYLQSLWKHYKIPHYNWFNSRWVSYQTKKITDKHWKLSFSSSWLVWTLQRMIKICPQLSHILSPHTSQTILLKQFYTQLTDMRAVMKKC